MKMTNSATAVRADKRVSNRFMKQPQFRFTSENTNKTASNLALPPEDAAQLSSTLPKRSSAAPITVRLVMHDFIIWSSAFVALGCARRSQNLRQFLAVYNFPFH